MQHLSGNADDRAEPIGAFADILAGPLSGGGWKYQLYQEIRGRSWEPDLAGTTARLSLSFVFLTWLIWFQW